MNASFNRAADAAASLLFLPAAPFLVVASRKRWTLRLARKLQDRLGVTVLRNHYYEPTLIEADQGAARSEPRELPGLDWNIPGQLATLKKFTFEAELKALDGRSVNGRRFDYTNSMFGIGDAEALYSFIRAYRPATLIEIGAGNSTIVARLAFEANQKEDPSYTCRHICFEPFENPWLEGVGAEIRRERIECADLSLFRSLAPNDIVLIDSSHVLRSAGDVECELLRIVPSLPDGVFTHVHDIFTPRDYPKQWLRDDRRLWTEQYLLEAFLMFNDRFEIVLALNFLFHRREPELLRAFPVLAERSGEPGSFWIRRKPGPMPAP